MIPGLVFVPSEANSGLADYITTMVTIKKRRIEITAFESPLFWILRNISITQPKRSPRTLGCSRSGTRRLELERASHVRPEWSGALHGQRTTAPRHCCASRNHKVRWGRQSSGWPWRWSASKRRESIPRVWRHCRRAGWQRLHCRYVQSSGPQSRNERNHQPAEFHRAGWDCEWHL